MSIHINVWHYICVSFLDEDLLTLKLLPRLTFTVYEEFQPFHTVISKSFETLQNRFNQANVKDAREDYISLNTALGSTTFPGDDTTLNSITKPLSIPPRNCIVLVSLLWKTLSQTRVT